MVDSYQVTKNKQNNNNKTATTTHKPSNEQRLNQILQTNYEDIDNKGNLLHPQ